MRDSAKGDEREEVRDVRMHDWQWYPGRGGHIADVLRQRQVEPAFESRPRLVRAIEAT